MLLGQSTKVVGADIVVACNVSRVLNGNVVTRVGTSGAMALILSWIRVPPAPHSTLSIRLQMLSAAQDRT